MQPTTQSIGEDDEETQAANDLCEKYKPLALKIARRYRGLGISSDELQSAAPLGLTVASRKFDPTRGAFGPYAKLWIKGELTRFFKPTADAMAFGRSESPSVPAPGDDQAVDETVPAVAPDLSELTEREKTVLVGRSRGETLSELGSELGVSQERVRQVEGRATQKAQRKKGNVALTCIRDLTKRRGYRKGRHKVLPFKPRTYACHTYTQAETEALVEFVPSFSRLLRLKMKRLSGGGWSSVSEVLRRLIGAARPKGLRSGLRLRALSHGRLLERGCGLSTVEIAKRKTPEEHLHKFLTHHEIERLRFDLRAKLCGGSRVERPRKGPWCNKRARVSPRYEAGAVVEHERYRNDGLRLSNGVPDAYEPKPTKQADLHTLIVIDLRQCAETAFRNRRGPYGGAIVISWGRP